MTYIEQLQEDKRILVDFFKAFINLEEKMFKYENTAYKGDALKAADISRANLNEIRVKVYEMLNRKTTKKGDTNAA